MTGDYLDVAVQPYIPAPRRYDDRRYAAPVGREGRSGIFGRLGEPNDRNRR